METFNQLLNHYVQRLGISDAELARAIGVSRQTIFRWREGLTARPRYREDVLVIARKLRLTPAERDRLLLAAGFRPEEVRAQESGEGEEVIGLDLEIPAEASTPEMLDKGRQFLPQGVEDTSTAVSEYDETPAEVSTPEMLDRGQQFLPQGVEDISTAVSEHDETPAEASIPEMLDEGRQFLPPGVEDISTAVGEYDVQRRALLGSTGRWLSWGRLSMVVGSLTLLVVVIGLLLNRWLPQSQTTVTPGPTSSNQTASQLSQIVSPSSRDISAITPALPGETVVLVTHFANYASSQVGYNVAGRLAEALQREIDDIRLVDMRLIIWPEPVGEREQALQVGRTVSATLVIYGQYDVGRIVVSFAQPADQSEFADPAVRRHVLDVQELSATINSDLPQQVRSLALMALGQIHLNRGQVDQARPLLAQARYNLENDPTVDEQTWTLVNFYLGVAYHHSDPPDLDGAIEAYTQAVEAWPQMISSRLNRSAAYEARKQAGDLALALADAETVIATRPDWALGYNNRASIRLHLGGTENLTLALADLDKTLTLEPVLPEAYFNRAYIHYTQGAPVAEVFPDLEAALALRPDYATVLNMLCWGYAVEQEPEQALPYCQQAVAAADPQPTFLDSRGLAYALLGDYPAAIADFQAYVAWLEQQPGDDWQEALARRRAWIDMLTAGQNPFTPQLLAELRHEFGP